MQRKFLIEMKTVLGVRKGVLRFTQENELLRGTLEMLLHKTDIVGYIKSNGLTAFSGTIVTLLKNIPFQAEGTILQGKLDVLLKGANLSFPVTGIEVPSDE